MNNVFFKKNILTLPQDSYFLGWNEAWKNFKEVLEEEKKSKKTKPKLTNK